MKYLIPIFVGGAAITATVTTAIAQAHGAFNGHARLTPYLCGYGISFFLLACAVVLAVKATKQEKQSETARGQNEVKHKLSALMRQERELRESLKLASDDSEYTELIRKADEWVNETVDLLKEADLPTDAETFVQIGHISLSCEQLDRFAHVAEWKREHIARLALYRQTLDQIMSNRRL